MIIAMQTHGRLAHLANFITSEECKDQLLLLDEDNKIRPSADLHIFWGYRAYMDSGLPDGKPFLIADKGFVRRPSVMFALTGDWGGMANWPPLEPRNIEIPEWVYSMERKALILGQEPKDFSTRQAVKNFNKWKFDMTQQLVKAGWEVRYRDHPRNLIYAPASVERPPLLSEDLLDIGLVVGLNTGALVECFLEGYPVHAVDPHSLVHRFSVDLAEVDQGEPEGREAFFRDLAGLSWTYEELADGRAWEALREHVFVMPEAPQAKTQTRTARKASRRKAANA